MSTLPQTFEEWVKPKLEKEEPWFRLTAKQMYKDAWDAAYQQGYEDGADFEQQRRNK